MSLQLKLKNFTHKWRANKNKNLLFEELQSICNEVAIALKMEGRTKMSEIEQNPWSKYHLMCQLSEGLLI
jgi:hypothetical protein